LPNRGGASARGAVRGTPYATGVTADPATAPPDATGAAGADVLSGPDLAGRVVRGGLYRVIGFGMVSLLGIASSVVLLHHLGVDDVGRYGTVIALVGIASGLADAGLNMTGSRELALLPAGPERRRLLGALLGVRLLLLTAAAIAAVLFAVVAGYDSTMVIGTALAAAGAVLIGAQSTLTLPLVVDLRNGLLTINELLKQVILVGGVVLFATVGARLTPFFAVPIMVGAGALLAVPLLVGRHQLAWPTLSRPHLRRLALMALPVALAGTLTTFYMRTLVVLASLLTNDHETGLFVTSARIIELIGGLAMLVTGLILPVATVAARDARPRLRYVLAHTTKLALLGGGLLALVVFVAARPIVVILGGQSFARAAPVLRLQAPVILSTFVIYAWTGFLIADGRRRGLVRCMLIGTAALLIAGLTLISPLGAQGGALAALAADIVLVAVMWRATQDVGDGAIGIERGYLVRYVLALGVGAGAGAALAAVAPVLAAGVVAGIVFTGLALALGIVPTELTDLFHRRKLAANPPH
jgi:O-antigen/teichoic acid export membrane protein